MLVRTMCSLVAATVNQDSNIVQGLLMGALTQVRVMGGTVSLAIW